jgi:spore coat protein U-like protein
MIGGIRKGDLMWAAVGNVRRHGWRALVIGCAIGAAVAAPRRADAYCWNITTNGVAFGTYDPFSATPLDAAGSISFLCLPATSAVVTLSRGSAPTFVPRQMRQGAEVLQYNLYRDASRTVIWGDGTGGTSSYGSGLVLYQSVSVYGRVFPRQNAAAGSYSDSVLVTVNF